MRLCRFPFLFFFFFFFFACGFALCSLSGCARPIAQAPGPLSIEDYFPLSAGNAWSYDADGTLVIVKVLRREGIRAELRDFSYEVRPDGIFRVPPGKYVLKLPFTVGAEWEVPNGGKARIEKTDAQVAAQGEVYRGCIVVEETDASGGKTLTSFAPGIGPVDVIATGGGSTMHATLRGFTRGGGEP